MAHFTDEPRRKDMVQRSRVIHGKGQGVPIESFEELTSILAQGASFAGEVQCKVSKDEERGMQQHKSCIPPVEMDPGIIIEDFGNLLYSVCHAGNFISAKKDYWKMLTRQETLKSEQTCMEKRGQVRQPNSKELVKSNEEMLEAIKLMTMAAELAVHKRGLIEQLDYPRKEVNMKLKQIRMALNQLNRLQKDVQDFISKDTVFFSAVLRNAAGDITPFLFGHELHEGIKKMEEQPGQDESVTRVSGNKTRQPSPQKGFTPSTDTRFIKSDDDSVYAVDGGNLWKQSEGQWVQPDGLSTAKGSVYTATSMSFWSFDNTKISVTSAATDQSSSIAVDVGESISALAPFNDWVYALTSDGNVYRYKVHSRSDSQLTLKTDTKDQGITTCDVSENGKCKSQDGKVEGAAYGAYKELELEKKVVNDLYVDGTGIYVATDDGVFQLLQGARSVKILETPSLGISGRRGNVYILEKSGGVVKWAATASKKTRLGATGTNEGAGGAKDLLASNTKESLSNYVDIHASASGAIMLVGDDGITELYDDIHVDTDTGVSNPCVRDAPCEKRYNYLLFGAWSSVSLVILLCVGLLLYYSHKRR